jgi:hypothetical protein
MMPTSPQTIDLPQTSNARLSRLTGRILLISALALCSYMTKPALAAGQSGLLPTSFIGEAATLSLAFAAPALLAGAFLLVRRFVTVIGVPAAVGVSVATAAGGLVLALKGQPDMLGRLAGL